MQKFSSEIALVYNTDNQDLALQLELALNAVIDFKHFNCCRDENKSITKSLQAFQGPIFLLISDNFLRTSQCMQNGLAMLNEHEDNLLPVVIPGYRINDIGEKEPVSTDFSRFKQIVQYINYWQDRYLDLRKQKRNDPDLNTEGFTGFLHTIRDIAGEAGQYLRTLQTFSPLNWASFSDNNFELLFEFLDDDELWETFKSISATEEITEDLEEKPVAIADIKENIRTNDTSKEIIDETPSIETDSKEEENQIASIIAAAWLLEENGEQEVALAQLKVALDRHPENISLRYNLAVLLAQRAAYEEAQQEITHLLNLTNEHEEILFLAGELADIQGDTSSAITYFQKLANANDDYPNIHYILGKLLQKQGDSGEKVELLYKKACKKNKKNSSAHYQLALLYLNGLGNAKKAEKHLKKTIKLDKHQPFAYYDLAMLYHKNEWYKKANKYYLKSIHLEPGLQTNENDIAFSLAGKPQKESKEDNAQAIKNKIKQLQQELEKLKTF